MKYIIKIITIIALSISLLLANACSSNGKKTETLKVAMELQFPPFEMSDGEGNPTGISVDMAIALGKYIGKEVEIVNTAWTGLIPSLQTGKADLIISSMTITEDRAKVVDFSDPYLVAGLTLLLDKKSEANKWEDLNKEGIIIAVKSGTTGAIIAKAQLVNSEIKYFEDVSACVLEVSQGKADAFIYDALTIYESYKNNNKTTKLNLTTIPSTASGWGIAIKKGNNELKTKVNEFIKKSKEDGSFSALENKYLKDVKAAFVKAGIPSMFESE